MRCWGLMFTRKNERVDLTTRACVLILAVAVLTITLCLYSNGISGNDFWWHIKVGEWVAEHRSVPTTDIFSWYGVEKEIPWVAHEWLSDLIFYGIYSTLGSVGVFVFCELAALLMIGLVFLRIKKYVGQNFAFCGIFLSLFAVIVNLFFYGRPHIFGFFLVFAELWILYDFANDQTDKKICLIPLLAVLWSNLHGGSSSLSYVLCLIFLFSGLFDLSFGRVESRRFDKRALITLTAVTFGTIVGILINPVGLKVLSYPFVNLSDSISMSTISEWQSPDAKQIGQLILYFMPMLLMSAGIVCGKKSIRFVDILVMIAFMFLFFRSVRFSILWYIAASFYAFDYIPEIKVKKITKPYEKLSILALLLVGVSTCAVFGFETVKMLDGGEIISKAMSDEAVAAVKADRPERIFNDYNLGETLIANDIPVFFDARADLYASAGLLADGTSLEFLQSVGANNQELNGDVGALIEKYNFDALLILRSRPLYSYLISHSEHFEIVYEDDNVGYFRVRNLPDQ